MNTHQENSPDPQSFEAALQEIERLVSELEEGNVPLERSLEAFERGKRLLDFCEQRLRAAEQSVKQLGGELPDEPPAN